MKNYHKNPRQIKDKQFANLRAWLLELGDLSGIVHDLVSDEVISGNQRMRAIDIAKCEIVLTEGPHDPDAQGTVAHGYVLWQGAKYNYRQVRWTAEQCEKANIVANKAGGSWDFDILANEWEKDDLLEWGFELEELGMFPDDETSEDPGAQIDKAEELREKWGVETGQLWQLGEHRLICGDCTDAAVVARVMGGERAQFCFTDPPYNVGVTYGDATDDNRTFDDFRAWCALWLAHVPKRLCMTVGIKRLLWWDTIYGDPQWIIAWVKRNGQGNTALGGTNKWDAILVYGCERDNATDMVELNNDYSEGIKNQGGHPTAKPVELWAQIIDRFSDALAVIYEPFSGSGTTIIASEKTGRKCRACEIEPGYVAVAIERWAVMTGGTPELVP